MVTLPPKLDSCTRESPGDTGTVPKPGVESRLKFTRFEYPAVHQKDFFLEWLKGYSQLLAEQGVVRPISGATICLSLEVP